MATTLKHTAETREQKIERLSQANPDVPVRTIEIIVDNISEDKDALIAEARSMRANSLRGTMDPMYT